ncbi:MAG: glycosyltransferase family 2 protein [Rikenellaceae bacterium]
MNMTQEQKITIVVPIYNVEEYLPRCLDSITGQTYHNIEVMLVDDGSPDGAGAICDEYAARDERIRVFHIPNGGVAKARQLGVEQSTGEYIVFVDPDDWLPLDSVETLYSHMSDDVDVVIGGYESVHNGIHTYFTLDETIACTSQYTSILLLAEINPAPWAKLYRRYLFSYDSFPVVPKGQDYLMNLALCAKIRYAKTINERVYFYLQRVGSTILTHKSDINYEKQYSLIARKILKNSINQHLDDFTHFEIRQLYTLIHNGHICSCHDEWIESVIKNSNELKISLRERVIIIIIRSPILQRVAYIAISIIKKFIH